MMRFPGLLIILFLLLGPLIAVGQKLRIDHVISLSADLDKAITQYEQMGFTLKPGRLHDNGLSNAHIKFANESSFELMSLAGNPTDDIAKAYKELLVANVTGAYLALTGPEQSTIQQVLDQQGIAYEVVPGKVWSYIKFPSDSEFAHIFFIIYHRRFEEEPQYTTHANGVTGFQEVTIEGTPELLEVLRQMLRSDKDSIPATISTPTGSIRIVPKTAQERPWILGVRFQGEQDIAITWK